MKVATSESYQDDVLTNKFNEHMLRIYYSLLTFNRREFTSEIILKVKHTACVNYTAWQLYCAVTSSPIVSDWLVLRAASDTTSTSSEIVCVLGSIYAATYIATYHVPGTWCSVSFFATNFAIIEDTLLSRNANSNFHVASDDLSTI